MDSPKGTFSSGAGPRRSSSLSCHEKILRFSAMNPVNVGEPVSALPSAVIVVRSAGAFADENCSKGNTFPTRLARYLV